MKKFKLLSIWKPKPKVKIFSIYKPKEEILLEDIGKNINRILKYLQDGKR